MAQNKYKYIREQVKKVGEVRWEVGRRCQGVWMGCHVRNQRGVNERGLPRYGTLSVGK